MAVIAEEEEETILQDWSANRRAVEIIDILRVARETGRQEEWFCSQNIVCVVPERRSMEVVRAGLNMHIHACAAGESLLRVKAVRDYTH